MENNTVFILLAGGKSERMGIDKGLLKYQNTFWILEQLNRISKSTIQEVYIGLGYNYQSYFEVIPWFQKATEEFVVFQNLKVKIVINNQPELGSFSTLQTVLKNIPKTDEIVTHPIDIPILNADELQQIISIKNEIVMPYFEEKNGHPIKMSASFWKKLITLNVLDEDARLDTQLKKVSTKKISRIEVFDKAILYNLNTKSDWYSYLSEVK
jgi:CTP:molybdopterin cytidylyltransferase MocA